MGQKTNPKGFRLTTTQEHLSKWYYSKVLYPSLIEEDYFIRLKTNEFFKDLLSISKIEIHRIKPELAKSNNEESVQIIVHSLFPREKEMSRKIINYFTENLKETNVKNLCSKENIKSFTSFLLKRNGRFLIRSLQVKTKKNYDIKIKFLKNQFEDATLIAKFIGDQLEKRTPFRRAVKQTIKKVQRTSMKGVKIQVSGRLNGIDIARSEWKRDGCIPLHTLKAKIDYTHQIAQTIYGVIGIKVWLFVE